MINGKAATNTINMWKLTKEYWKDMWVLLWSKTTVDDIIIAKAKNIQAKAKAVKQALKK